MNRGLGRHYPRRGASVLPRGVGGASIGALVLVKTAADKLKVTWGPIIWAGGGKRIPSNVETEVTFTGSREVWLEIEMQTTSPWAAVSAIIKAESAGMPDPEGPDPVTGAPPSTVYFLLGEVTFAAGEITDVANTNANFGGAVSVIPAHVGTVCVPADPGDPLATPPIPATDGGLADRLSWEVKRV